MKTYSINFYSIGEADDGPDKKSVEELLRDWANGTGSGPAMTRDTTPYKVKDLVVHPDVIRGIFAKFRHEDLPRIGSEKLNTERDIDIEDEEGLIEKNHFIFYPKKNLILYQSSREGSHSKQLENYLIDCAGRTYSFNPILREDSWNRLTKAGVKPKKVELSVASPKATLLRGLPFNRELKKMMDSSGTYHFRGAYSIGRHKGEYLDMDIKAVMTELMANAEVSVARVTVDDDDGDTHVIDLFLERIKGKIAVTDHGRYPDSQEVFKAMANLKAELSNEIDKVLADVK